MDYTAILILACIFIPLERLIPLHEGQAITRRDWFNDLLYLLFNGFIIRFVFFFVIVWAMWLWQLAIPQDATAWVRELPLWVQVIAVMIIADIGYYTAHRLSHTIPFLWRFHAVHHSIEELDWLAAHRVHPLDQVFTNSLSFLPIFFIGFSGEAVLIHVTIFQVHALLLHANVRFNFGPLKWLIASPDYHHWHHANQKEAYDKNFAAQLSVIDVIAGTMFLPRHKPEQYGVSDPVPRHYPQQLLYPFVSNFKSLRKRFRNKDSQMSENSTYDAIPAGSRMLQDRLGMLAMIVLFGWMLIVSLIDLIPFIFHHKPDLMWGLAVVARLANLIFLAMIVGFTAIRLPAQRISQGILPQVTALAGTFAMMLTALVPVEQVGATQQIVAAVLSVAGLILSAICLFRLGRSFAIAPAARKLVTAGPYRIVRHPLYAAELVAVLGIVVGSGSWYAAGIGAIWIVLQIARARFEERVLLEAFPEYADYSARVPMLVPGLNKVTTGWLSRSPS